LQITSLRDNKPSLANTVIHDQSASKEEDKESRQCQGENPGENGITRQPNGRGKKKKNHAQMPRAKKLISRKSGKRKREKVSSEKAPRKT